MNQRKRWLRKSQSANNFDLILESPQDLDYALIEKHLDNIQKEKHRGLSLSARADKEFRRWSNHPDTPLKSEAYVLASNWFLTQSGDRLSMVATHCEALWDELFPCRPERRLSSPEPGRNHAMVPSEFESFWGRLLKAQGKDEHAGANGGVIPHVNTHSVSFVKSTAQASDAPLETRDVMTSGGHGRPLTIAEAKTALALAFGVSPDQVEITIRG